MVELADLECLTLFTDDLEAAREFYCVRLERQAIYEDHMSFVVDFGALSVNLLSINAAEELVEPAIPATPQSSAHAVLTLLVADVDSTFRELEARGVSFVNGPINRPWGRRTATFADPSGHLIELAQRLN